MQENELKNYEKIGNWDFSKIKYKIESVTNWDFYEKIKENTNEKTEVKKNVLFCRKYWCAVFPYISRKLTSAPFSIR